MGKGTIQSGGEFNERKGKEAKENESNFAGDIGSDLPGP
jgi:hypothetical protein